MWRYKQLMHLFRFSAFVQKGIIMAMMPLKNLMKGGCRQDAGAMRLYQGHTVSLEWQSLQTLKNNSRVLGLSHRGSLNKGRFF